MRHFFRPGISVLFALTFGLVACNQEAPAPAPPPAPPAAPVDKPIQIPKVSVVANDSDDWVKQAHQVLVLRPSSDAAEGAFAPGATTEASGAKTKMAIAWTPTAILFQIRSEDTTPFEADTDLWKGDSVEIFLTSIYGVHDDLIQIDCTPGRTTKYPDPRWHIYDWRKTSPPAVNPAVHVQKDAQGYTMTVSVPMANFNHVPQPGDVIGMQVYVNDLQENGHALQRTWYPGQANLDASQMERVQLADQADPPEVAAARLQTKGFRELAVGLRATAESAGKAVEIWSSGKQVASDTLAAGGANSTAEILLPHDLAQSPKATLMVTVDGQPLPNVLTVPNLIQRRLDFVKGQTLTARPLVFDGTEFPPIDFLDKELIEAAIGSYTLNIRYFDSNWNEVTKAETPGRYGARIEYKSEDGTFTKNLTLFKTAQPYFPAKDPYSATVKFPAAFGLSAEMLAKDQWNINDWTGSKLERMARGDDPTVAAFLAGMQSLATDPAQYHGFTIRQIEDSWWNALDKRLGKDQEYPHLVDLPEGYDKDQRAWPLLLYLHYSWKRGGDLNKLKDEGPLGYVNAGHPLPFIVVSPLCVDGEWWDPVRVAHLIDELSTTYRIDPKHIYVTGASLGGYGTWQFAATYPDKVTAIAPVSGAESTDAADRLKKIPTWVFHGSEDSTVPTRYDIELVQALQKLGAPVKITIAVGAGHRDGPSPYSNPEFYDWLLKQSK